MKHGKKICAVLLAVLLLLPLTGGFTRTGAAGPIEISARSPEVPVILIGGDGDALYDKDGNYIFQIDHPEDLTGESDRQDVLDAFVNVMRPFLREGVLHDNWEPYSENLEAEIAELTAEIRLDENGNVPNGSGISQEHRDRVEADKVTDRKGSKGYYDYLHDYRFWYDWRLDPMEIADQLNDYIEGIKSATGCPKVALCCRCVGSNVALAYVAKYGAGSLQGLGFDGTGSNGGEFISEALSGKFRLDGSAVERFLIDYKALGSINLSDFALASIDLLVKSGTVDGLTAAAKATVYYKILKGATSALALSTLFTMPCYWGFVAEEDYEDALLYVFGDTGSEKRVRYAGLIEKLDRYHNEVVCRLPELLRGLHENGVNLAVISKYGFQMFPICASGDLIGDQYASVKRSSFGATTSTVYDTLPEDYIAAREAEGKGKYISPDKQIDASTCMFPDYTWFTKGAKHGTWTPMENALLCTVTTADRQYTVEDLTPARFNVYDAEGKTMQPMTQANCHTENWKADRKADHPAGFLQRFVAFFRSWTNWLKQFFLVLKEKIKANAS